MRIIPIGGLGEMGIGKNMMAIEYDNDIIVIDMGFFSLAPTIQASITLCRILPTSRSESIRSAVWSLRTGTSITSARSRHLVHKIPAPIYASKFTTGMLQKAMEEATSGYQPHLMC